MKKITRRIALGTLFGGAIACPFVLRALRSHKEVNSGELQVWRDTWTNLRRELRPEMEEVASSGNFRCVFDPHRIPQASYSILVPVIEEFPYDFKDTPDVYGLIKGVFQIKRFGPDTVLLGQNTERVTVTAASSKIFPFEPSEKNWAMLYESPQLLPVTVEGDSLHKAVSLDQINMFQPYQIFAIDAPNEYLKVGAAWTVEKPADQGMAGSVSRKVSGVYRLGNSEVVRVTTAKVSQTDEIAAAVRSLLQNAGAPEERKPLQQELAQISESELTADTYCDAYYDLATGLLVYREINSKMLDGKSHQITAQNVTVTRIHLPV
ncbi:MAG: hypothetical protein LBT46_08980 [Planctomycetaceae bacterium]|jgi:hypothetical protein|nr:hypothetical protein [Planctomycetaceae bacterium]